MKTPASSLDERIGCVRRELAMRKKVYGRKVREGTMDKATARRQYDLMSDVLATLENLKGRQQALFEDPDPAPPASSGPYHEG